jgi:nicotinamide mononucleotide transporter
MIGASELAANALNAAAIVLAGRDSLHTWWTGILGCLAFAWVFYTRQLYADVTLQVFFVGTSVAGWWNWAHGARGAPLRVRHAPARVLAALLPAAGLVALGYGWLLRRYTDAYAPFLDSVVLAFSVLGQLLLMGRRVESWWCWLIVNTVAVPLYASRGLHLTALLYAGFWVNALLALRSWRQLAADARGSPARFAREPAVEGGGPA